MSAIWDRCESLTAAERYWSSVYNIGGVEYSVPLSIDTSVKSPQGTGSIKLVSQAIAGAWEIYLGDKFNPEANLLKDFNVDRPASIFVQGIRDAGWRVEIITRDPSGLEWNSHIIAAQRIVPANTMTEILLDYSSVPASALQMTAQLSVVVFVDQQAFTGYISGIFSGSVAGDQGMLSVDTSPVKGEVFVDGASLGMAPINAPMAAGPHVVGFGAVAGYVTPPQYTINITAGQIVTMMGIYTTMVNVSLPTPILVGGMTLIGFTLYFLGKSK